MISKRMGFSLRLVILLRRTTDVVDRGASVLLVP